MQKQLFSELKQVLSENGYHKNGDLWGASMGLFFDVAAFVYEYGNTPAEWQYRPGAAGNFIDTESYNYDWLLSLDNDQREEIGGFLHRLTNKLRLAGLDY